MFASLFLSIPHRVFTEYAETSGRIDLKKLAVYYAASLPWEENSWKGYLGHSNPALYIQEMQEKILPWRKGAPDLTTIDEEALRGCMQGSIILTN
jgi:hypothetical protein